MTVVYNLTCMNQNRTATAKTKPMHRQGRKQIQTQQNHKASKKLLSNKFQCSQKFLHFLMKNGLPFKHEFEAMS